MANKLNNILQPVIIDGVTYGLDELSNINNSNPMIYQVEPSRALDFSIPDINNIVRGEVRRFWLEFEYLPINRYRQLLTSLRKPEFQLTYYDQETDEIYSGMFYCTPFESFENYIEIINGSPKIIGKLNLKFELIATNNELLTDINLFVSYNNNGGTGVIANQNALYGETIQLNNGRAFSKTNSNLVGWSDGNVVYALGSYITIMRSMYLKAVWQSTATRILSFDYQGAQYFSGSGQDENDYINTKEVTYDELNPVAIGDLPKPVFWLKPNSSEDRYVKNVYNFYGWYDFPYDKYANDGIHEHNRYTSDTLYKVNGNITLYAHWIPVDYTIRFETNGGSAIEDITQGYMTTIKRPNDPTKSGYTFLGWFQDKEFKIPVNSWKMPYNENVNKTTTYYAKWEAN